MPIYTDKETGRLFIQFRYKCETYKRRLPADTTRADAKKLEAKWLGDVLFRSFGIEKKHNISYEDFLADHFLPFAETHYSAEGFKNVLVILKASLKFLKGLPIRKITAHDIEKFRDHRKNLKTKHGKDRKPATIHRELNIISKVFSEAVRHDFLDVNPCRRVARPVYDSIQDKIIPLDKLQAFLDNFTSAWARDVAVLILNTGLRQNDALGLKKHHADFDNRIIRLIQGKSKRKVIIPMNDTVFELLSARVDNESDLFFPSPKTGKQGTSIKKALQVAGKNLGLGNIGTRVLRRTFATYLQEKGFSASSIAKLLGHSDLRSIHRYERGTEILKEAVLSNEIKPQNNVKSTTNVPDEKGE